MGTLFSQSPMFLQLSWTIHIVDRNAHHHLLQPAVLHPVVSPLIPQGLHRLLRARLHFFPTSLPDNCVNVGERNATAYVVDTHQPAILHPAMWDSTERTLYSQLFNGPTSGTTSVSCISPRICDCMPTVIEQNSHNGCLKLAMATPSTQTPGLAQSLCPQTSRVQTKTTSFGSYTAQPLLQ